MERGREDHTSNRLESAPLHVTEIEKGTPYPAAALARNTRGGRRSRVKEKKNAQTERTTPPTPGRWMQKITRLRVGKWIFGEGDERRPVDHLIGGTVYCSRRMIVNT